MSKRGISQIKGPTEVRLGEKVFYEVSRIYDLADKSKVETTRWKLYVLDEHTTSWRELKPKYNDSAKLGYRVPLQITNQMLVGKILMMEAYIYEPERRSPPGLMIKLLPGTDKKITRVDLFKIDNTPIKEDTILKYNQSIKVKVYTQNMLGEKMKLSLYEDDVNGGGHNKRNEQNKVAEITKKLNEKGFLWHEFKLNPNFAKIANAMMDGSQDKLHEYYVVVEAAEHTSVSKNVEVENPDYVKIQTVSSSGVDTNKTYGETLIEEVVIIGKMKKQIGTNPPIDLGNKVVTVSSEPIEKKEEKCLCKQYDLIWGNKVSCGFRKRVVEICMDLWPQNYLEMANNLMAVFRWESGGTFKSDAPNQANSGGTGLIQFMPSTASSLLGKEVTIEIVKNYYGKKYNKKTKQKEDWQLKRVKEFADMTDIKQLDYVKKYFEPLKGKKVEFIDFYLQVLFPASSMQEEHIVFASSIEKLTTRTLEPQKVKNLRVNAYNSNSGMDINKDGKIWKSEIKTKVQIYITEGMANKVTKFECNSKNESTENKEITLDCKADCICNLDKILIVNGFIDNSQIKKHRVDVLEQSKFINSKKLSGIILHRTVTKTTQATINAFSNKRLGVYYGTHFIVGKDGDITQTAHLDYKTNHAKGWNSKSIGIEVVGMPIDKDGNPTVNDKKIVGWEDLTEKQAMSVACLTKALLKYYSLKFEDLHCHEDVSSKTKGEGEYVLKAIQSYFK
ncbi:MULTISPECIES: N-acetylmuramoyl-L-alanine amidase [unclassified Chryseobacterium]|uniref:N-acetylmuramoyl-L-alanine amidase n=1 Tax=unclassified Chryseobacterium TaxID=2593645 RepID=UPI00226A4A27|nr:MULTISPECIES: N-acetylmuramoyl-L-alanine amidase [unclassified Chryseobacterium]